MNSKFILAVFAVFLILINVCVAEVEEHQVQKTPETEQTTSNTQNTDTNTPPSHPIAEKRDAIRNVIYDKIKALNSRNCTQVIGLYDAQATLFDPVSYPVVGARQIAQQCVAFLEGMITFYINVKKVMVNSDPHQALLEWVWVGVTAGGCLFQLDGYTHFSLNEEFKIISESDYYSVSEMKNRMLCENPQFQITVHNMSHENNNNAPQESNLSVESPVNEVPVATEKAIENHISQ